QSRALEPGADTTGARGFSRAMDQAKPYTFRSRMKDTLAPAVVVWMVALGVAATTQKQAPPPHAQTVRQYCVGCHNDRSKAGDLSLAAFDVARASDHPEISEKIIRKLRAGMMPPAGARRPDRSAER